MCKFMLILFSDMGNILISGKYIFCREEDSTFRRKSEEPDGCKFKKLGYLHEREVYLHISLEYGPAVKCSCGITVCSYQGCS